MKYRTFLIVGLLTLLMIVAGCVDAEQPALTVRVDPDVSNMQPVTRDAGKTVFVADALRTSPESNSTPVRYQEVEDAGEVIRFSETQTGRLATPSTVFVEPDTQAAPLGELAEGELVVVTGEQDGWYRVIHAAGTGGHGWLPVDAVTFEVGRAAALTAAPMGEGIQDQAPAAQTLAANEGTVEPPALPEEDVVTTTGADSGSAAEPESEHGADGPTGRIVFQSSSGGEIYLLDLDTNTLRYLTYGLDPALSPNGNQVAFTRWDDPRGLYTLEIESGEIRRLVGDNLIKNPTWSPDGTKLIFSQQIGGSGAQTINHPRWGEFTIPADPHWRLQVIDVDGKGLEGVDDQMHSFNPDWSGSGVLYADGGGIYVTEPGGETWPLYVGSNTVRNPAWSPDGGYIVATMEFHDHWEIVRLNADGSRLVRLTKTFEQVQGVSPTWSPDGRSIVYLADRDGEWKLWIMNPDGSAQTLLASELLAEVRIQYDFNVEHVVDWE